jgi:hypothetical protein
MTGERQNFIFIGNRLNHNTGDKMPFSIVIPLLTVLAWVTIVFNRRKEKLKHDKKIINEDKIDDGEYHNDFSKVPAGTADPFQPPPRSIGYGYGDGGQSVMEDLERIGIKKVEDKKSEE